MSAVVVYESMYGNTRRLAEAIADGIAGSDTARSAVRCEPVAQAATEDLSAAQLVVIGAPTHAWSLSRPSTRRSAAQASAKPAAGLVLEPRATGGGVREWLAGRPAVPAVAVFGTRMARNRLITGSSADAIARRFRRRGIRPVAAPENFLVSAHNELLAGELERARAWGARLAQIAPPVHA
jgi:hypothetical protein